MKIATYNVNGITARLPQLLTWLSREAPDVACLQELKAEDKGFPRAALERAGYGAVYQAQKSWHGVAILARGCEPVEVRRGLPGDAEDTHSRYLEAAVNGILVACLYLPNGNPQPGPKFDYKLAWFERLIRHAKQLWDSGAPAILAGDFNVVPTDLDIYNPKSWKKDALLQPESRAAYARLLAQGWTDALRVRHPGAAVFTFWDYFRNHWNRNAGLRIDHLLLSRPLKSRMVDANVDRWVRAEARASDHAPAWVTLTEEQKKPKRLPKIDASERPKGNRAPIRARKLNATASTKAKRAPKKALPGTASAQRRRPQSGRLRRP